VTEICPVGVELFRVVGQTDRRLDRRTDALTERWIYGQTDNEETNSRLSQFCERAKKDTTKMYQNRTF